MTAKQLKLDGLDRLRDTLDTMAQSCEGWQFIMSGAPEPHDINSIQVEAYNSDSKRHAGIVIREEDVISGTWETMLTKLERGIKQDERK